MSPRRTLFSALLGLALVACSHAHASPATPVALGDSITWEGSQQPTGWVNQYMPGATNLGVIGATSADLLNSLNTDPAFAVALDHAPVVTLDIGTNDFIGALLAYNAGTCGGAMNQDCLTAMNENYAGNLSAIVARIRALDPCGKLVLGDLYHLPASGAVTDAYQLSMNAVIHAVGNAANVSAAFGPDDAGLLADGVHPNVAGNDILATTFRAVTLVDPCATLGGVDD